MTLGRASHARIGNHEAGVMRGDLRNVLPAEFEECRTADSDTRVHAAYDQEVAAMQRRGEW